MHDLTAKTGQTLGRVWRQIGKTLETSAGGISASLKDWKLWPDKTNRKSVIAAVAGIILIATAIILYLNKSPKDVRTALLNGKYQSAFEELDNQARAGDASAQNSLGNLYYLGLGVEQNYSLAASWYKNAAINGNQSAYVNMGILHFRGVGLKQDLLRAYAWLRLAERAGKKSAEHHLLYLSGINLITPNMMQQAHKIYGTVDDLIKTDPKSLRDNPIKRY